MYQILIKEDGLWLSQGGDSPSLARLGPREDREAIEDAMLQFLEADMADMAEWA